MVIQFLLQVFLYGRGGRVGLDGCARGSRDAVWRIARSMFICATHASQVPPYDRRWMPARGLRQRWTSTAPTVAMMVTGAARAGFTVFAPLAGILCLCGCVIADNGQPRLALTF